MKNIIIHTFIEGNDDLNDVISILDKEYVRHYGSLEINDGEAYIEFVGTCVETFTQEELQEAVEKEIETIREYVLRHVSDKELKKFLEV